MPLVWTILSISMCNANLKSDGNLNLKNTNYWQKYKGVIHVF